jgi:hypothetical protein
MVTSSVQQNVAAFNDRNNQFVFNSHNHLQISEDHDIASNSVSTFNDGTSHFKATSTIIEEKHMKKDISLIPTLNLLTTTR